MKTLTRDQLETRKEKAARFVETALGDPSRADEIADESLDSYAERDAAKAIAVWSSDKEIDAAHGALLRELLTHMMEDPRNIVFCAHLLFCSKNLERMGDHTTNIAESVHYMVTGQRLNGDRPKEEDLSFLRVRSIENERWPAHA